MGHLSLPLADNLQNPPANRKQGPLLGGMFQTLPANKKQGKVDQVHAAKIIEPAWFRINRKTNVCFDGKSEQPLKNLKTSRDSFRV
jgi:hypothetical protein